MKVVALVSGGKDSCYNMVKCIEHGHEIVCLANLRPPNVQVQELDSWMFQTVGHNVISAIAECMELPLFIGELSGSSLQTTLEYDDNKKSMDDEVENLYNLLKRVKEEMPEVGAVSCGAIFSDYQRFRVENVCSRLGLVSLSYLWRRPQEELLDEMIKAGMNCVLIKTASMGLFPQKHLGKTLAELQSTFMKLKDSAGLNVCGEGGEYESLTIDCPLFKKRIVIDKSEIVMVSQDNMGGVGHLLISEFHLENKVDYQPLTCKKSTNIAIFMQDTNTVDSLRNNPNLDHLKSLVNIKIEETTDKLCYVVAHCKADQKYDPSLELFAIFQKLSELTPDMAQQMVHCVLQISGMNCFGSVNQAYCHFFSSGLNRPSRVCIANNFMNPNQQVAIECLLDRKKTNPSSVYANSSLFVQSVSEWAPSCIGPYAQATSQEKLLRLAGQIAFIPETMELINATNIEQALDLQTTQCLKNIDKVLDGMRETRLEDCFRCLTYLNFGKLVDLQKSQEIVQNSFKNNASKLVSNNKCLMQTVFVPDLPRGALVEIHVFAYMKNLPIDYEETYGYDDNDFKEQITLSTPEEHFISEGVKATYQTVNASPLASISTILLSSENKDNHDLGQLANLIPNKKIDIIRVFTTNSQLLQNIQQIVSTVASSAVVSPYLVSHVGGGENNFALLEVESLSFK